MSNAKNAKRVKRAFDREGLSWICTMPEAKFAAAYGMVTTRVNQPAPDDFYHFRDHGSNILAVAHLDTVSPADQRGCHYVDTEAAGPVVYSRALDDRLGAYIILDLLPALGIQHDVLLTVGEESGRSTARFFEAGDKQYDWIIEFDRGGTDVVMYQFEDADTVDAVEEVGATVGIGSFSDISDLEHLEVKAFNWGVGYRDYHGPRSHAYLNDTFSMVGQYLKFHEMHGDVWMPHAAKRGGGYWWDDDELNAAADAHAAFNNDGYWRDDDELNAIANAKAAAERDDDDIFAMDYYRENPTADDLRAIEERYGKWSA